MKILLRAISKLWKIKWLKLCKKYHQIKGSAVVWWKLKLSVLDEPTEREDSETIAKKKSLAVWDISSQWMKFQVFFVKNKKTC